MKTQFVFSLVLIVSSIYGGVKCKPTTKTYYFFPSSTLTTSPDGVTTYSKGLDPPPNRPQPGITPPLFPDLIPGANDNEDSGITSPLFPDLIPGDNNEGPDAEVIGEVIENVVGLIEGLVTIAGSILPQNSKMALKEAALALKKI